MARSSERHADRVVQTDFELISARRGRASSVCNRTTMQHIHRIDSTIGVVAEVQQKNIWESPVDSEMGTIGLLSLVFPMRTDPSACYA